MRLGLHPLGTWPLGGMVLHDPPTVTVTGPTGTITTGGPYLTVAWDYVQAQGDPQEWYRVQIVDDADAVIYHDTGWVEDDAATYQADVGQEPGVPGYSTDLAAKVYVRGPLAIGTPTRYQADDLQEFDLEFGDPHLTIVTPVADGLVFDSSKIVTEWTFTDDVAGKTQAYYRVRIKSTLTGQVLTSTGWVASAATAVDVPYLSQDGSKLTVEIQAKNSEGILSD